MEEEQKEKVAMEFEKALSVFLESWKSRKDLEVSDFVYMLIHEAKLVAFSSITQYVFAIGLLNIALMSNAEALFNGIKKIMANCPHKEKN